MRQLSLFILFFYIYKGYLGKVSDYTYRLNIVNPLYFNETRAANFIRIAEAIIRCKGWWYCFYKATNYMKKAAFVFCY